MLQGSLTSYPRYPAYGHLRRSVLLQTLMAIARPLPYITKVSKLDLLFLKDFGWYDIDTSGMDEIMTHGKGKGCEFYFNNCKSNQKFSEFCQYENSRPRCSSDRNYVMDCDDLFDIDLDNCYIYHRRNICSHDEGAYFNKKCF